jgi:hypothetical protein
MLVFSLQGVVEAIDIVMMVVELIKFIACLIMTYKILTNRSIGSSRRFLMASNGTILRIQSYLYSIIVMYSYTSNLCLGPIITLGFGTAAISLRIYHNFIQCREQLKL